MSLWKYYTIYIKRVDKNSIAGNSRTIIKYSKLILFYYNFNI